MRWILSDTAVRTLTKTVTWRLTGSTATFIISYIILRDASISGSIAIIQLTFNTVLYFIHERVWDRILWGKKQ